MSDTVRVYVDGKYWTTMSRELYEAERETSIVRDAIWSDLAAAYAQNVDAQLA